MKKILVGSLILVYACSAPQKEVITDTKQTVIMPDQSLFDCPIIENFPDTSKLTDVGVAKLLVQLFKNNMTCHTNIGAIQKFLEDSQKIESK